MARHRFRTALPWVLAALVAHASAFAQALPRAKPDDAGVSSERLARLTQALDAYVENGHLAGGVALVLRDGKIVYSRAFGHRDREAAAPMQPDTIFRIASQTKALVSVAAMMLQEDGRLVLSDPVGRYLPEFAGTTVAVSRDGGGYDVVKAKRPITIRDLLTHAAGIGYGGGVAADRWKAAGIEGWYFANRDEPIGATVSRMAALPFDAQPGERWVYGYATDILGAIVERVSGETLEAFLQARFLTPLRMMDTPEPARSPPKAAAPAAGRVKCANDHTIRFNSRDGRGTAAAGRHGAGDGEGRAEEPGGTHRNGPGDL